MQGRRIDHLDEAQILADAAEEAARAFERAGMTHLLDEPADYWGVHKRSLPG
jgi:hypothetical protein